MTIEEYCKQHKIHYYKLAEDLGVSKSYVSKVVYGYIIPNDIIKNKLEKLGIDVGYSSNDLRNKKDNTIKMLTEQINSLLKENEILRKNISVSIDNALSKLVTKKSKTVYVLITDWYMDCGETGIETEVFSTLKAAQSAFEKAVNNARIDIKEFTSDVTEELETDVFSTYETGEYGFNHINIRVIKKKIG